MVAQTGTTFPSSLAAWCSHVIKVLDGSGHEVYHLHFQEWMHALLGLFLLLAGWEMATTGTITLHTETEAIY